MQTEQNSNILDLLNLFMASGFIPTISKPTRITHASASLIDNIYVKINNIDFIESGILTADISDHLPIFTFWGNRHNPRKKTITIRYRPIDNGSLHGICHHLDTINWDNLKDMSIDDAYKSFSDIIQSAIDRFFPEMTKRLSQKHIIREKWMTPSLLKRSSHCYNLYKKSLGKPKTSQQYLKYTTYRNVFIKAKKAAKQNYYTDKLNEFKHDSKNTWKLINSLINNKSSKTNICDTFKVNDGIISDPNQISTEFCKYFTNIGRDFASKIPSPQQSFATYLGGDNNPHSFFMEPCDPNEISNIITSLKSKTSCGLDGVSPKTMKLLNHSISTPISILVNKSLQSGVVPPNLKIAKVIPIYKSKDKTELGNYRPISLLPSLSKILEKVVHRRLYKFCAKYNLLSNYQFGFRPNHSTSDAVLSFMKDIYKIIEQGNLAISVFLDLSKAFDTIDHTAKHTG